MSAASPKSEPKICEALPNATSSPASECGVILCDSPDGPMIDLFGREVVLADHSRSPDDSSRLLTSGTYGRTGLISSKSRALSASLVSRLKTRLNTDGSILFKMTWKPLRMQSGRLVYLLRARARRTSDREYSLWPTPRASESGPDYAIA